jgi:hypothetical protein
VPSSLYQEIANAINGHELGRHLFGHDANMHRDMARRLFAETGCAMLSNACMQIEILVSAITFKTSEETFSEN